METVAVTAPKMSLYQIQQTLLDMESARADAVEAGDQEAVAVIDAEMNAWLTREADKVTSFAGLILARKDLIENAKRAVERDKAILKAAEADVERLEGIALAVMQNFGVKEIKDSRTGHGLKRQGNGGVRALDIPEWPKDAAGNFKPLHEPLVGCPVPTRSVITWVPDTEKIRYYLAQRVPCPECKGSGKSTDEATGSADDNCLRCKGAGTIPASVPGARLLPKGEHVRVL